MALHMHKLMHLQKDGNVPLVWEAGSRYFASHTVIIVSHAAQLHPSVNN